MTESNRFRSNKRAEKALLHIKMPKNIADVLLLFPVFLMQSAGFLKAAGYANLAGVDITVLSVALLCTLAVFRLAHVQGREWRAAKPILWFLLLLTPAFANYGETEYAGTKLTRFLFLTLPAAAGTFVLLRSERAVRVFLGYCVATGLLAMILAYQTSNRNHQYGRWAVGDNVLALGYNAAVATLIMVVRLIYRKSSVWKSVPLIVLLVGVQLASGSRGPLVAVVVVVLALTAFTLGRSPRLLASLILLVPILFSVWKMVPAVSRARLLTWDADTYSLAARIGGIRVATEAFGEHPLNGIGFGRFPEIAMGLTYPHNIFAEVACEAGLLGLVGLTLVLVKCGFHFVRSTRDYETTAATALLGLWFLAAQFSDDLCQRGLWISLACYFSIMGRSSVAPLHKLASHESVPSQPRGSSD